MSTYKSLLDQEELNAICDFIIIRQQEASGRATLKLMALVQVRR